MGRGGGVGGGAGVRPGFRMFAFYGLQGLTGFRLSAGTTPGIINKAKLATCTERWSMGGE